MSFKEKMLKFYGMSNKRADQFLIAYNLAGDIVEILVAAGWIQI